MTALFARSALLPTGWAENVRLILDTAGNIAAVEPGAAPGDAERVAGPVLPGMPNLHSHAFQRAMAGLTERASATATGDDFWSWRDAMYRFLGVLAPEDVRAIAAQLYLDMLKAGYTGVAEFHYLHHGRDGRPYAERGAMSEAVIAAAEETGIAITLLPTLFQTSGFGGAAPTERQRRFINSVGDLLAIVEDTRRRHAANPEIRVGLAHHSLRAVPPEPLAAATAALRALDATAPIHIHVAEQTREVAQCLAWSGARPVQWLLDHAPVDATWCLVHATHMDETETRRLAATGAIAGLCPTTEANLGDGFFPLLPYLEASGRWGIGSDSHVSLSPIEELRWLEYGQRLRERRRALAPSGKPASTGLALWQAAVAGGAKALGRRTGALAPGYRADLLVLDAEAPSLYRREGDALIDSVIFASESSVVHDVMAGGRWVIRDRHHAAETRITANFRRVLDRLAAV
ncbi:MAG TPA: formimidoylglutamate deiminase [Stellaceae bacterium]|nr:formimidoylglutamate deiminase [Stellaceae bacterium]